MPLTSGYLNTPLAHPARIIKQGYSNIPTTDGLGAVFTPSWIHHVTYTNPATIATTAVMASHAGAGSAGTTSPTLAGTLATAGVVTFAHPRNVVITVTHGSSIVAMSGTITGTDQYGAVITEAWAVTATGTSKTNTGKKAFKTVTSITEVIVADASANTIIAGNGKVLGLPFANVATTANKELEDGAAPTAGVLVVGVAGSATADSRGTYTPNSTLNGALDFDVWYTVDDPTAIAGV